MQLAYRAPSWSDSYRLRICACRGSMVVMHLSSGLALGHSPTHGGAFCRSSPGRRVTSGCPYVAPRVHAPSSPAARGRSSAQACCGRTLCGQLEHAYRSAAWRPAGWLSWRRAGGWWLLSPACGRRSRHWRTGASAAPGTPGRMRERSLLGAARSWQRFGEAASTC